VGKFAVGSLEQAQTVVTGAIGALNGTSTATPFLGPFNVAVWGVFVGTLTLESSFDGGTTWIPVLNKHTALAITFTAPSVLQEEEVEPGVLYQLTMTAYTSGSANYRISEGAAAGRVERLS
jgi:hypothetical protein